VIFCQEYTWTQKVQKSNDANENEKSSVELILSLGEENLLLDKNGFIIFVFILLNRRKQYQIF